MENWESNPSVTPLTNIAVPQLDQTQLNEFTQDAIHSEITQAFDVAQAAAALKEKEGQRVLGADFGGDKGSVRLFEVQNGKLVTLDDYKDDIQGNDGAGYVDTLKKAANYAEEHSLSFGISWGGPLRNESELVYHPKAKLFMSEMDEQFGGDLRKISPTITAALNDGPAGLIQGAVEAYQRNGTTTLLFVINGGGLGLAVLSDNKIFTTEAGHVKGVRALNTYNQTTECGVFDATYTCLEQFGANKAGIEVQWQASTGDYMRARDIEDRYKEGDDLARDIYDHSALVVAHMIQGTASSFAINLLDKKTGIVCHGGAFKFPKYGERVCQIIENNVGNGVSLFMTKDYTNSNSNACLDGAAIAALIAQ